VGRATAFARITPGAFFWPPIHPNCADLYDTIPFLETQLLNGARHMGV